MCVKAGPSENEPLQGYNLMEEYCATEAAVMVCLSVISEGFFLPRSSFKLSSELITFPKEGGGGYTGN